MARTTRLFLIFFLALIAVLAVVSCSSIKHVPDGQLLLDKTKINILDKENGEDINANELVNYLRQTENHKVLGGFKMQLAIYNLSGKDSTKWFNRWIQRVGSPPVIYDSTLTMASVNQLQRALINKGFLKSDVASEVKLLPEKKKAQVTYNVTLNKPYTIRSIKYDIKSDSLRSIILSDTTDFPIKTNSLLDHNKLDSERELIVQRMRNNGYYAFNKNYITFLADTAAGSREVDLTLTLSENIQELPRIPMTDTHRQFYVRNVVFVTNYDAVTMQNGFYGDTVSYNGIIMLYGDDKYIDKDVLYESCFIRPMQLYNASDVDRTYKALGRLGIIKFINIDMRPFMDVAGDLWVDAYILLNRDKSQTISFSLEGTNSEGDLGFGIGADYQHRNIFKGSEILNVKFKASYESLSGDLSGLINDNYSEYSGDVGITFPKFKMPFLPESYKRRIQASTEFMTSFNYQERPEYTRIIAGAGWKYIWSERNNQMRHTFNLIDISYVYLPKSKINFLDSITNPLLRYSYENHLIMRMGYTFYKTNKRMVNPLTTVFQNDIYTIRATGEIAGNLLYGISHLIGQKREEDDSYKVFGTRYSQYIKLDGDFALTHYFNHRSSVAMHAGFGIAIPYGNSTVLPFEKRFYSGGANSVRGWGVRTLGPGSFDGKKSQNSFIYQCGDIRLDLNIEYRCKLFWVLELGAFIDCGNVWTIREYENQPGGVFKIDKFYEQLALSYGLGLRMDFSYFLMRFDVGMKAHNPASGQEHWPLFSPQFKRDAEFHFSIGYPF
ncbi:MAG: BamA/TamA family outer membrane protein [Muribaculaceae bacterium]|nr:BamA/TamA family outer membrane protein [Muribaculaceae bacterium]MBR5171443.1 BamA/TamA family outer membrane protein [Muribaculaceae bacterium]